ncbi:MAG: beta-lactamase domain protein [Cyanobacteria bacterium RYN_339]|nr:beta-lactamase domain protein [Cyanobacteria bacterium RYN_339]
MPAIERLDGPRGARIYRLPMRVYTGLEANAYVVVDGAYQALIDTGSGLPESDEDLAAGFEALRGDGVSWESLDRIIVTHGHIDHYGGLDYLRARTQAPVAIHAYDRRVIEQPHEHHTAVGRELERFFAEAGLDPAQIGEAMALYHTPHQRVLGIPAEAVLADGDLLDGRFQVVHAPGHCAGQVCLQLGDLLFSADHILPETFPHLAPESTAPWTGVAHYLAALDRVEALPGVRLTLPGHGAPIADLAGRIAQLRTSHLRKLERVQAARAEARTLVEITRLVYPRLRPYHALLALEKVGAYIEYLG